MGKHILLIMAVVFTTGQLFAQENPLERFDRLMGKWQGTGEGFGGSVSEIDSEFNWVMNKRYVEVKNHSEFEPTPQNPEGEVHDDWGMISYDRARKAIVFRQFHVEGFVNQYVLNDSLSNEKTLVFESEVIENFVPGGKARWTIKIVNENEIETVFDLAMPGQEMVCYGTNRLKRK